MHKKVVTFEWARRCNVGALSSVSTYRVSGRLSWYTGAGKSNVIFLHQYMPINPLDYFGLHTELRNFEGRPRLAHHLISITDGQGEFTESKPLMCFSNK
jgi:hypothetical protein